MKILIVDDTEVNIKLLRSFLHKWNYTVIEAYDGNDAILKFKNETPDMILMDIVMPNMDGRESAKIIKALSGPSYIPIIFLTALKENIEIIDALDSGGDDFISKPFDKDLLYSKIKVHERIINLNNELEIKNKALMEFNDNVKQEYKLVARFFEWGQEMCDVDPDYVEFYTSPVSAFNGDLFLSKRSTSGCLYVLVGDFTGHGLPAAIGSIPVMEIFFRLIEKDFPIDKVVREVNSKLYKILPVEIFFAALIVQVCPNTKTVSLWSGGLPESYIVDKKSTELITVKSEHMPLGVWSDAKFNSNVTTYSVNTDMKMYCCTDGILEAFNENDEMYGDERLKAVLIKSQAKTIDQILLDVNNFTDDRAQNDDVTIVELSFENLFKNASIKN